MRIALICGIYVPHDAISAAVEQQARLLLTMPEVESVTIFSQFVARPAPCEAITVATSGELLNQHVFYESDLAIFHWGIHYDLFNSLIVLASTGPKAVCHFHNCTPAEFLPDDQHDTIRRSFEQLELLPTYGIRTWTYSPYNRRTLAELGMPDELVDFVPFPIQAPRQLLAARPSSRVEALVVGRLVRSKGLHVVVEALGLLDQRRRQQLHLRVVGNLDLSHDDYLTGIEQRICELGLGDTIEFIGTVDDDSLWNLYETSHVLVSASLHEGLCVPVVEAYLAGCRAIGTTAGNLPFIVSPTDPIVEAGDPSALAVALSTMIDDVSSGRPHDTAGADEIISTYSEQTAREALHGAVMALAADLVH